MARYEYQFTIIHRCGHPGSYRATWDLLPSYKTKLRERDCDECRNRKGGLEVVAIDGKDFVLPAITTGSEAQVSWAVKIRRKVLTALLKGRQEGAPNPIEWMRYETSAKWWIDRRNLTADELIQGLHKAA